MSVVSILQKQEKPHTTLAPLISIIMPVYQAEATIADTIRSVLRQSYRNFEIIIVDDGCTDQTITIINSFKDSRIHIIQQQNGGVAQARNNGFAHSKGEYIAFLDADDLWFPDKLETDLRTLQKHDDPICLVYSGFYNVDDKNHLINFPKHYTGNEDKFKVIIDTNLMIPSTAIVHRRIMEKVGGFPVNTYHEDRVFFIHCCKYFPAYPTDKRTVIYRQALSGRMCQILSNYPLAWEAEMSIVEALRDIVPSDELQRLTTHQTRSLLSRFLKYNLMANAIQHSARIPVSWLLQDKKGLITLSSLMTQINFFYGVKLLLEFTTRYILAPWWHWKKSTIFKLNSN